MIRALKNFLQPHKLIIADLQKANQSITAELTDLQNANNAITAEFAHLQNTHKSTTAELQSTKRIFGLVTDILKAPPADNVHIQQFHHLVRNDFKEFCNKAVELNQMDDMDLFEKIENEMKLIAHCPPIHSKTLGAIGGGFSSGKSSFINSFMLDDTIKLATGIIPVTVIPSYVICGDTTDICGISYQGGQFKIQADMYKDIAHELLKTLDFDLRTILRYITVTAKLDSECFSNVCLVDTPGYNAASTGTMQHDRSVGYNYIKDAKFLIWVIGLDSNGTFPKTDIEFLMDPELPFGKDPERNLYIVANKARGITPSNREKILEDLKNILDDNGISYDGISIYEAQQKEEYLYEGMPVREFLKKQNIPAQKYAELAVPLKTVFERYEKRTREKYVADQQFHRRIQTLLLDGMEHQIINISSGVKNALEDGLNELKSYILPTDLTQTLTTITEMEQRFFDCINRFCDEIGIQRMDTSVLDSQRSTS